MVWISLNLKSWDRKPYKLIQSENCIVRYSQKLKPIYFSVSDSKVVIVGNSSDSDIKNINTRLGKDVDAIIMRFSECDSLIA